MVPFVSGSISGAIAALFTTPLDVTKTHMQVELGESGTSVQRSLGAGSFVSVMRKVVAEHGYAGLFAGLAPRIAKIAPACAIMIASTRLARTTLQSVICDIHTEVISFVCTVV